MSCFFDTVRGAWVPEEAEEVGVGESEKKHDVITADVDVCRRLLKGLCL